MRSIVLVMCFLVLLLASSACSLVLNTDELRNLDGGPSDTGSSDTGPTDGDVTPDASDAGMCEGVIAVPNAIGFDLVPSTGFAALEIRFAEAGAAEEDYSVRVDGLDAGTVTLPAGDRSVSLDYPVGLFAPDGDAEVVVTDRCNSETHLPYRLTDESPHTLDVLTRDAGPAVFTSAYESGATLDIANDGTVVFAASEDGEATSDGLYLWPVGGPARPLVSSAGDLVAPRISDDGALVVYNDADSRAFHYRLVSAASGGVFNDTGTVSVTSDLRVSGTGDAALYHFAMRDYRPEMPSDLLLYGAFPANALVEESAILREVTRVGGANVGGRSPVLHFDGGDVSIAAVNVAAPGFTNAFVVNGVAATGAEQVPLTDDCVLDAQHGLMVSAGDWVAFVGDCGGTVGLHLRELTSDTGEHYAVPGADGLLAADDDLRTFLLRGDGYRAILRLDGMTGEPRTLADSGDLHSDPTAFFFLSNAALSPNGRWAVLSLRESASGASDSQRLRIARVLVQ